MNDLTTRPNPSDLLEAFLASKRSEEAFTRLVESLSGLVYSSALRRTQNPPLTEEITQNVFAIMARKAESLRRHPALTAWILETTRLQAASAMRSEARRRRKIAALASEAGAHPSASSDSMNNEAAWKDAVPVLDEVLDRLPISERHVVLQRFYEGKKFKEIAAEGGQTEAAAKMRLKRALEKLSRMLTARGVTLSTTVVASALGTELARSAPIQSAAVMAPKALAASSSLPAATIIANTIQTMSNLKTTTATAAAVLAVAAIPVSQQVAEGSRLQSELRVATSTEAPGMAGAKSRRPDRAADREPGGPTAAGLLAALDSPAESRALLTSMLRPYHRGSLGRQMALLRISRMTPEEHAQLLKDLESYPHLPGMDGMSKELVASTIRSYGPQVTPQERMERMIASGKPSYSTVMRGWAADDPDAALAWFDAKVGSGELFPGLSDDLHEKVLTDLVVGLGSSRPETALEIYQRTPRSEMDGQTPEWLGGAYAAGMIESGDDSHLQRLLEIHAGRDRTRILSSVAEEYAENGLFEEGIAFVDAHKVDPGARFEAIRCVASRLNAPGIPDYFPKGHNWVLANTTEAEAAQIMNTLVGRVTPERAREWLTDQVPGETRDRGFASLSERLGINDKFAEAMEDLDRIQGAALRATTRESIARRWLEKDPEAAAEALPAELIEQLQNQ